LVEEAAGPDTTAREALGVLCEGWWRPVYSFIRRRGYSHEEAEDLTQEFFTRLIEKNYLRGARRERGTPGAFVLGCLRHFLANEWDRARAQKRGGTAKVVAIDDPERDPRDEPSHPVTPERNYENRWALGVLDRTVGRLRAEFRERGQLRRFAQFEPFLTGPQEDGAYAGVAAALRLSETAVKVGVHRFRQRYGALLREELGGDADGEIRFLIRAVGSE
jgi:RNA polymerase sigma-70 factor (ECF subfamily)